MTEHPPETDPDDASAPDAPSEEERRAALPEVARRALEEAEARLRAAPAPDLPPERGGRKGPEPTRYGDWERKGIASDF